MNILECEEDCLIGHIKTRRAYKYLGKVKCKVDGCWVVMHSYENCFGELERFCRFEWDFEGFERIGRNL